MAVSIAHTVRRIINGFFIFSSMVIIAFAFHMIGCEYYTTLFLPCQAKSSNFMNFLAEI
jgi:hypothetical protein